MFERRLTYSWVLSFSPHNSLVQHWYSFYPLLSFSFAPAAVCVCRWTTMPGWQGGTYVLPMPALTLRIQAKTASWPRGHRTNSKAEGVRCCCERQFIYPYGAVRLTSTTVTTTYISPACCYNIHTYAALLLYTCTLTHTPHTKLGEKHMACSLFESAHFCYPTTVGAHFIGLLNHDF